MPLARDYICTPILPLYWYSRLQDGHFQESNRQFVSIRSYGGFESKGGQLSEYKMQF